MVKYASRENILIPRMFNIHNYNITLKKKLTGDIITFSNMFVFRCEECKIFINLKLNKTSLLIDAIKFKFLDIYLRGSKDISNLDNDEISAFYMIDNVVNINITNKIFVIAYKHNYTGTIMNTFSNLNFKCKYIELEKNIELYEDNSSYDTFNNIFRKIKVELENYKTDKVVLNITNLDLKKYPHTMQLIEYLEHQNKKIIYIINGNLNKFKDIFGKEREKAAIHRDYVIYCGNDYITRTQIQNILN